MCSTKSVLKGNRKKAEAALLLEKAKAAAAVNQAKSAFLENMRYDLRTAVSGILALAESLADETDLPKIRYFSEYINKASRELLRFLNEFLEWIQVASGATPLLSREFSLKEVLENVLALHQPMAMHKHLQLSLAMDEDIPECLISDPVRIYCIMLELLTNAFKFTQTGSIDLVARLAKEENQTAIIKLLVRDTGIGIPPDKRSEIFTRFNRLTSSYQGIYKGTGLGLSIVKQFVDELDGEIYVESDVGIGSQFLCTLPFSSKKG